MILPLTTFAYSPQVDHEQILVREFLREAHTGIVPDQILEPFGQQGAPTVDLSEVSERGWRVYRYRFAEIVVDVASGRIVGYGNYPGAHEPVYNADGSLFPRRVSDRKATELAQRFYRAAGWPGGFVVDGIQDAAGDNSLSIEIRFTPSFGGVPYADPPYEGLIDIDRETGLLTDFLPPGSGLPRPPASLVPTVPLAAARLSALRFAVELRGESLAESATEPMRLCIWLPPKVPVGREAEMRRYRPSVRSAIRSRQGILAYSGWLLGGGPRTSARVVVDANSGEVLDSVGPSGLASFGGGSAANDRPTTLSTDLRSWQVAFPEGAWTAPANVRLTPAPSLPFSSATKVILSDGKAAFPATYDPRSGLLGIGGRAYRPGPALAELLRRRVKA